MSVAEAFSHFDANTMFDNALARVRRTIGVRELPHTVSVRDYLDAQGLTAVASTSHDGSSMAAANESVAHTPYHSSLVASRHTRRSRRALRA